MLDKAEPSVTHSLTGDAHVAIPNQGSQQRFAVDNYGCKWVIFRKNGADWAFGVDEDEVPCIRQVFDGAIVTDWSRATALRHLDVGIARCDPETADSDIGTR